MVEAGGVPDLGRRAPRYGSVALSALVRSVDEHGRIELEGGAAPRGQVVTVEVLLEEVRQVVREELAEFFRQAQEVVERG